MIFKINMPREPVTQYDPIAAAKYGGEVEYEDYWTAPFPRTPAPEQSLVSLVA